jgi:hypothetical protein
VTLNILVLELNLQAHQDIGSLEVENFMYIANVDEPYGPESVNFLFFWNIVQEPMAGRVIVGILVLSC